MKAEKLKETLYKDFSVLTIENKKKIVEMTKFLVITQNSIVPEMLNIEKASQKGKKESLT